MGVDDDNDIDYGTNDEIATAQEVPESLKCIRAPRNDVNDGVPRNDVHLDVTSIRII